MNAGRFRSKEEIRSGARRVSFTDGWRVYGSIDVQDDTARSFSLETLRAYDGDNPRDRKDLVETYGDGGTLYIIAVSDNSGGRLEETDARLLCTQVAEMGYVPFFGVWYFKGRRYEDVSFAVDHGVSEMEIRELLEAFGQLEVYVVTYDRAKSTRLEDLSARS